MVPVTEVPAEPRRDGRAGPPAGQEPASAVRETSPQTVSHTSRARGPIPIDPLNAESSSEALSQPLTPNDGFFVRSHFPTPTLHASTWKLAIGGDVKRPRSWSLAELRELPQARVVATLECAGNSRRRLSTVTKGELRWGDRAVGSAVWQGVPLSLLVEEVEPLPDAHEVVFSGADKGDPDVPEKGFARSLLVDRAVRDPEILVATDMNGSPLAPEHGWPARLVVPGWYGMAWVKWLTEIRVRKTPFQGYYQTSRYVYQSSRNGQTVVEPVTRLRVKSIIVAPTGGERLARGRAVLISGKAWSGFGPVTRVEVNVGSGWGSADLAPGDGPFDWSGWTYRWTPSRAGRTTVRVRAADSRGETQPEHPLENDFQYGTNSIHGVEVVVA